MGRRRRKKKALSGRKKKRSRHSFLSRVKSARGKKGGGKIPEKKGGGTALAFLNLSFRQPWRGGGGGGRGRQGGKE